MGISRPMKVLIDTNILLYIYDGLDPFFKVINLLNYKPEFYIHTAVLRELEILSRKNEKGFLIPAKIRIANKYLDTYKNMWKLVNDYEELPTDKALLMTALKYNMLIFTNDKELKHYAIKNSIGVLFLQEKGKIIKSLYTI
ncbi:MAG: PIN domain-containing protein [Sulfolobaceae archaeon]